MTTNVVRFWKKQKQVHTTHFVWTQSRFSLEMPNCCLCIRAEFRIINNVFLVFFSAQFNQRIAFISLYLIHYHFVCHSFIPFRTIPTENCLLSVLWITFTLFHVSWHFCYCHVSFVPFLFFLFFFFNFFVHCARSVVVCIDHSSYRMSIRHRDCAIYSWSRASSHWFVRFLSPSYTIIE